MPVPNTFANATTTIPLSDLDNNFATPITIGNTAVQLGNTVTTLNNMTLANVTISSVASTFPNNYLANSSVTLGTTAVSLGSTGTTLNGLTLTNVTISSVSSTFPNNYLANSSVTLGNTALTLGSTVTSVGNLTVSNVTVANAVVDSVNVTGYMGLPQNIQNGNYNIVLGDAGKQIYHPVGQAAATYTIPANSNVAFTTGTAITIVNSSANNVSIAITTDTMTLANSATTGTRTLTANGVATCVKVTSTSWLISGAGLS
jgi:hypothetical protein